MAAYKFHIKKTEVSDAEINQTKDFKRLKHSYDNAVKPMFKIRLFDRRNKGIWIALTLIFLVIFLLTEDANQTEAHKIYVRKIQLTIKPTIKIAPEKNLSGDTILFRN